MSARLLRVAVPLALGGLALALLVAPSPALAWGPMAHLGFGVEALSRLASVPAPTRSLLAEFGNEFLYGSLAADIVVGKNLAPYVYHCHNWRVGFNVLAAARGAAERAFGLGFLAHLAADTVAHNYFVPYKTVASFHRAGTGHAYWELRYDQRMDRDLSRVAREVSAPAYRGHDAFLRRAMPRRASVLPFPVTRTLFGSMLASARSGRFQALSRGVLAPHRRLPLEAELVDETRELAVAAILGVLAEGEGCAARRADATGARALRAASRLRRSLAARRRTLPPALARQLTLEARHGFRRGLAGPLELPPALARMAA